MAHIGYNGVLPRAIPSCDGVVRCPMMQKLVLLASTIITSVALVAGPADAASKKGKDVSAKPVPEAAARGRSNAVLDGDGRVIGVDPDPVHPADDAARSAAVGQPSVTVAGSLRQPGTGY